MSTIVGRGREYKGFPAGDADVHRSGAYHGPVLPAMSFAMPLPDHDFDPDDNFRHAFDDEDDMDLDDTEALVWNLLVLINPGDEETALRQFAAYRDATGEDGVEPDQVLWAVKDAIDWTSGFYVDGKDAESFIDCVDQLAARYAIGIDWGGDASDGDFLDDTDVPALMATAYDRLREHGYTLWNWNTGGDAYAGWMALRRDDDGMQQLAAVMGVEIRPGSDAF